ncbi:hypothetical protein GCM10009127_19670 [Alteraurantiacibacter aestuarii]
MPLVAALASLSLAQPASAQMEFNEQEVTALARVGMPSAFQSLQQRCRSALPGDAYIYAQGNALRTRLQSVSQGAWPQARSAIIRLVTRENAAIAGLLASMPPESLQPFVDEMIAGMVATRVEVGKCGQIDRFLQLVDPLPAQNLAELIGFIAMEAQKNDAGAIATGLAR